MANKTLIQQHIAVYPGVQQGRPCIKDTRTPVYVILEALALGMSAAEIQKEYGPITKEAIQACILFAAQLANEQESPLLSA